jgi:pheromone shutdown protein TraB
MLGLSDEYMAAMINKASETYRNIMVICGYGQTRSIPHYLYYSQQANSRHNMREVCSFRKPFESLIRKDNPET